jgi:iron complex transport system permease protein
MTARPWPPAAVAPPAQRSERRWRRWSVAAPALVALCLVLVGLSVCFGARSVTLTPARAARALWGEGAPRLDVVATNARLPRALLGLGVGMALGAAGALLQALYRNPLASPEITGVTQGAVAAAAAWLTFGPQLPPGQVSWALPAIAALGACLSAAATWGIARLGGGVEPIRLVLIGVLVGGILSAVTSICLLYAGESAQVLVEYLAGSLAFANWAKARLFAVAAGLTLPLVLMAVPRANLLQLGDDVASGLGQGSTGARAIVLLSAAALTAAAVCTVGGIGFVGLVAPHLLRGLVGSDVRRLAPAAALTGGALVLVADLLARNFLPQPLGAALGIPLQPVTLPVGVFLALFGGPFFLAILRRTRRSC